MNPVKKTCACGRPFYTTVGTAWQCADCLLNPVKDAESSASLLEGMRELPPPLDGPELADLDDMSEPSLLEGLRRLEKIK